MLLFVLACSDPAKSPAPDDSAAVSTVPEGCPDGAFPTPSATWARAGNLNGGDMRYFAATPDRPDEVWGGSSIGGLVHSEDGGHTWTFLHPEASAHAEGDLVIDPAEPGAVYYTAGDAWRANGHDTEPLNLGSSTYDERVRAFAVDPAGTLWAIDSSARIFRSADRGANWEEVATIDTERAPPAEAITDPESARELDVTFWALSVTASGALLAARHGGSVYRSTDGVSWEVVHAGPAYATAVAVVGEEAWIAVGHEVYHSEDGGQTWGIALSFPSDVVALDVAPDGTPVYATPTEVKVGASGALTALPVTEIMGVGFTGAGAVLVGHHEGILRSDDGGATWEASDGTLYAEDPSVIGIHPSCPGLVLTGTWCTRGIYRSTDGGQSFVHESEVWAHYVMVIAATDDRIEDQWVTSDESLWYSADFGLTWEDRAPGPLHLHALAIHPDDPDTVLVGSVGSGEDPDVSGRVYWSDDAGRSWTIADGLPQTTASAHALAYWPGDPDRMLLATHRGGIFHTEGDGIGLYASEDGGRSWAHVPGMPANNLRMVRICNDAWVAGEEEIYRSQDGGVTWLPVLAGDWESLSCWGDRVVVTGPGPAARRSTDSGDTWEDWSEGLSDPDTRSNYAELAFTPDGALVYAADATSGVWYRGW